MKSFEASSAASLNRTYTLTMSIGGLKLCLQLKCLDIYSLVQWPFLFLQAVANFGQKMVIRYQKSACFWFRKCRNLNREVSVDDLASSLTFRWCQLCSASADFRTEPTVNTNRCLSLTRWSHFTTIKIISNAFDSECVSKDLFVEHFSKQDSTVKSIQHNISGQNDGNKHKSDKLQRSKTEGSLTSF